MTIKVVHLRTANPEYVVTGTMSGEIAFCNFPAKHLDKNIKNVTCKKCLKAYAAMLKVLKRL
jgi:hypothetical protein